MQEGRLDNPNNAVFHFTRHIDNKLITTSRSFCNCVTILPSLRNMGCGVMKVHAKWYYRAVLVLAFLLFTLNATVLFFMRQKPFTVSMATPASAVKGIRATGVGSVKINLAGLLLPAHGPSYNFMKERIINDHDYRYLNNPSSVCRGKTMDLVVAIVSSAINFDQRRMARRSRRVPFEGITFLFFLGTSQLMIGLQQRIDKEAQVYGDIVQEDFIDTTRNLSLKSVAILRWVSTYCPHTKFVLKKDDDVALDLYRIMKALLQKEGDYQHFVMGNSKYLVEGPIRDEVSKYYTSYGDFGETFFPMFVHGPAYGFPGKTAEMLFQVSLRTKLFWLEDVYITGICAHKAGIPVFFDYRFVYKHASVDTV